MSLGPLLILVEAHPLYWAALVFFASYPMISSILWVSTALIAFARRERHAPETPPPLATHPPVSVLIPTFCEERVIGNTLEWATRIDYPDYEVVVVDDASTDGTIEAVRPFVERHRVRLIAKRRNEGKAMALNDAIPCVRGDIILIIDADAAPDPAILRWMVPHFRSARVAGVTGNPRVANRDSFLAELQVIEFSSIVSLLRRAQRVWGRLLTMSGVVGAFRRSALLHAGLYSPEMATEDIDLTWKLQRAFFDIRYESHAIVWMKVPRTLPALVKQRARWARGLAQVLRRHIDMMTSWQHRRMWPVIIESILSILWAYCFVVLTGLWVLSLAAGVPPRGASPIPNLWGMTIGTMCLVQLLTGVMLDHRYDRQLVRYFPIAVLYPIIYWMLMAIITVCATPSGLFRPARRGTLTQWRSAR